jgi:hypothetical protein
MLGCQLPRISILGTSVNKIWRWTYFRPQPKKVR